jgi:hypothetical protein
VKWQIRLRNIACTLCLCLCAFAELYSAGATALDRFAPSWERAIGWLLFLLPIELIAALILLLYAGFMVVDVFAGSATPFDGTDWLMIGLWAIFFAVVSFSARLILAGSRRIEEPATQSFIETIHLRG